MRRAFLAAGIVASLLGARTVSAQEKPQAETPAPSAAPLPPPHLAYLDKSKVIYVTAFDASPNSIPGTKSHDPAIDASSMGSSRPGGPTDEISHEPPRLVRLMADDLLRELRKLGYRVKFLGFESSRPDDGILVMGVFTQVGHDGQSRRVVFIPEPPAGAMQVVVTTVNLYHSPKPLYSAVSADDSITLNPDVAVLKFNLGKDLSDKAIKKTANQVVAELERISLQAQAEGLGGSGDPLNKFSKP
jgi:hypothetical protein